MTDEDSDGSDCGTNYDSGKGGSYLDVYKLSKSIHPINRMRKNKLQLVTCKFKVITLFYYYNTTFYKTFFLLFSDRMKTLGYFGPKRPALEKMDVMDII